MTRRAKSGRSFSHTIKELFEHRLKLLMQNFFAKLPYSTALVIFPLALLGVVEATRADSNTFSFEAIRSLDDMQHFVASHFSLGSPQQSLRKIFVAEGKATLKFHPTQAGVEK
jgi:hypothetical protein